MLSFLSKNRTNHNDYFDRTTASKGKRKRVQKGKNRVPSFNVTSPDMMTTFPPARARGSQSRKAHQPAKDRGERKINAEFSTSKILLTAARERASPSNDAPAGCCVSCRVGRSHVSQHGACLSTARNSSLINQEKKGPFYFARHPCGGRQFQRGRPFHLPMRQANMAKDAIDRSISGITPRPPFGGGETGQRNCRSFILASAVTGRPFAVICCFNSKGRWTRHRSLDSG